MFHMIALEQTFVNALLQNFFLLLLLNRIDSTVLWYSVVSVNSSGGSLNAENG